ncbi:CS1 type fimbrial major subunit [Pseudomonas sp. SDO5522_S412]
MAILKKTFFVPFSFVAVAASVQAADPIEHTIMLQATVPTSEFYVVPSDKDWIGTRQELGYNVITEELGNLRKSFDVKHIAGSITAQLTSSAILASSSDNIPLTVKFNNIEVNTNPTEVISAAQAKSHSTANLEIIPTKPSDGYVAGKYAGNVNLSFDAVVNAGGL